MKVNRDMSIYRIKIAAPEISDYSVTILVNGKREGKFYSSYMNKSPEYDFLESMMPLISVPDDSDITFDVEPPDTAVRIFLHCVAGKAKTYDEFIIAEKFQISYELPTRPAPLPTSSQTS